MMLVWGCQSNLSFRLAKSNLCAIKSLLFNGPSSNCEHFNLKKGIHLD